MELHHPIMSMISRHGGWLKRRKKYLYIIMILGTGMSEGIYQFLQNVGNLMYDS